MLASELSRIHGLKPAVYIHICIICKLAGFRLKCSVLYISLLGIINLAVL
jgi:hypothetical protein